jgi:hypothetical protein
MPLFKFLVQSTISNVTNIWVARGYATIKNDASYRFRKQLAIALLRYTEPSRVRKTQPVTWQAIYTALSSTGQEKWQNICYGAHAKLSDIQKVCIVCAGRGSLPPSSSKRRKLEELTESQINAPRQRTLRTKYGCNRCKIYICNNAICWQQHMALDL